MSDFKKGLIWTAVPRSVVSILGILGAVWFAALVLWIIALVVGIICAIKVHSRALGSGILAGVGISFVVLMITCFVNLNSL